MGFLLNALGVGIAAKGVKKVVNNIEEEARRKNTVCRFDDEISKEEFYVIVKRSWKKYNQVKNLYAEDTMVYGTIRSSNGIDDWCFRIDFNDYGKLTGKYWLTVDKKESDIPEQIAKNIAKQIEKFPYGMDMKFDDEVYEEELREAFKEAEGAKCPYCGKKNTDENAKYCMGCGMRFRV